MDGVAGGYAEQRYRRGLRSWRRRVRRPFLLQTVPIAVLFLALALALGSGALWWAAGFTAGVVVALAMYVWLVPPENVLRWGRGAEGERMTASAIGPLLDHGWEVRHDVETASHGNIDHLVLGPAGVFLIETKNLNGELAIEDGVLVARSIDDPESVSRFPGIRRRALATAAALSEEIGSQVGSRPWVHAVVVLWGAFPQTIVEEDRLTWVHGKALAEWLGSRPAAPYEILIER